MLGLILSILKIIGILILVLLAVIFIAIISILFIPIRYKINIQKYEDISAEGNISWFLKAILLQIIYKDGKPLIKFKILGKDFLNNNKKSNKLLSWLKNKRKSDNNKSQTKKDDKLLSDIDELLDDLNEDDLDKIDTDKIEQKISNKVNNINDDNLTQLDIDKIKEDVSENVKEIKDELFEDIGINKIEGNFNEDKENILEDINEIKGNFNKDINKSNKNILNDTKQPKRKRVNKTLKFKKFLQTIKRKLIKIKLFLINLIPSIKQKIINIIEKLKNIKSKIKDIFRKIKIVREFFKDDVNKAAIGYIFKSLKKVIKHILPTKWKANLKFGTGNPCTTGQILGIISIFMPMYKNNLDLKIDFETENLVLEGDLFIKGNIRIFSLVVICIKLLINKNFRQLRVNFKQFKEELNNG